jgi:hypothetical protein
MTPFTVNQLLALGKNCSHCEKIARWVASLESPAYCDDHFPYWDFVDVKRPEQEPPK